MNKINADSVANGDTSEQLKTVEGVVVAWLPTSGTGIFESNERRVGFKRKSFTDYLDDAEVVVNIGDSVVGEVNSDGFAVTLQIKTRK